MYVKLDVKCPGPNTHLPCTKRCKIRGIAELDVFYLILARPNTWVGCGGLALFKTALKITSNLFCFLFIVQYLGQNGA